MIDRHQFIGQFVAAYLARVASIDRDFYSASPLPLQWDVTQAHDAAESAWTAHAAERARRSQLIELDLSDDPSPDPHEPVAPDTQEQP